MFTIVTDILFLQLVHVLSLFIVRIFILVSNLVCIKEYITLFYILSFYNPN